MSALPPKPKSRTHNNNKPAQQFSTPTKPSNNDTSNNNNTNTAPAASNKCKPDMTHLVGRALVPFFSASGEENTTHQVDNSLNFSIGNEASSVKVRQFVDGYFVDSGSLANDNNVHNHNNHHTTNDSVYSQINPSHHTNAKHHNNNKNSKPKKSQQTPVKSSADSNYNPLSSNKKQTSNRHHRSNSNSNNPNNNNTGNTNNSNQSNSISDSSKVFAAPAFTNAPSPLKIPLPNFLKNKPTTTDSTNNNTYSNPEPINKSASNSSPNLSSNTNNPNLGPSILHLLKPNQNNQSQSVVPPTHDPVTGLPTSLMHLINSHQNQPIPTNSKPAQPIIVNPAMDYNTHNSRPIPVLLPPTSLVNTTSAPLSNINNNINTSSKPIVTTPQTASSPPANTSTFTPKLLFLRADGDSEDRAVVTTVPIAPVIPSVAPSTINNYNPPPAISMYHSAGNVGHNPYSNPAANSIHNINPVHIVDDHVDLSASLKQMLQIK